MTDTFTAEPAVAAVPVLVERAVRDVVAHGALVRARVEDGVVLLVGRVPWRSDLDRVERLVRAIPGVVEVRNRIGFVWDDGARA